MVAGVVCRFVSGVVQPGRVAHLRFTVIVALHQWGDAHAFQPGEAHWILVDGATGAKAPALRVERSDGATLTADNAHVAKVVQA